MVNKIGTSAITSLTLYAGVTSIVDNTNSTQNNALAAAALTDLTTPKTNKITLTSVNKKKDYLYLRMAVLCAASGERVYSQVFKLAVAAQ